MTPCPICRGQSLAVANEHASRTGCRVYRVTARRVPVPTVQPVEGTGPRRRATDHATDTVPPVTAPDGLTPAQWLAREYA